MAPTHNLNLYNQGFTSQIQIKLFKMGIEIVTEFEKM